MIYPNERKMSPEEAWVAIKAAFADLVVGGDMEIVPGQWSENLLTGEMTEPVYRFTEAGKRRNAEVQDFPAIMKAMGAAEPEP